MVQVGYNYYSQTYELKKKKQEALYPSKSNPKFRRSPISLDSTQVNGRNAEIYL